MVLGEHRMNAMAPPGAAPMDAQLTAKELAGGASRLQKDLCHVAAP
jgi:hypothetical protein